jgi:twinkle protein
MKCNPPIHRSQYSRDDLAVRLADQAEDVARYLLLAGHRKGHEWRVGSVNGEPGNSLAVHLTGTKRGIWRDFAGDDADKGDLVSLWFRVRGAGRTDAEIFADIRDYLGLKAVSRPARRKTSGPRREARDRNPRDPREKDYPYRDETGQVQYEMVRRYDSPQSPDDEKWFRPRCPDGKGGWIEGLADIKQILYRQDELLALPDESQLLVLGGEKDVDRAWSEGLPATTNPFGEGNFKPELDLGAA